MLACYAGNHCTTRLLPFLYPVAWVPATSRSRSVAHLLSCPGPPLHKDTLFVSASTHTVAFRAGMDSQGLRLLAVGMPGTVSFGSLLSGMGVPNAASLGDILTVTATTVLFVPGSTGGHPLCIARGPAGSADTDLLLGPRRRCLPERVEPAKTVPAPCTFDLPLGNVPSCAQSAGAAASMPAAHMCRSGSQQVALHRCCRPEGLGRCHSAQPRPDAELCLRRACAQHPRIERDRLGRLGRQGSSNADYPEGNACLLAAPSMRACCSVCRDVHAWPARAAAPGRRLTMRRREELPGR